MARRGLSTFLLALAVSGAARGDLVIPAAEALKPPTAGRLTQVHASAQRTGWADESEALRATARRAYEGGQLSAALAWYRVYQWSAVLGQVQSQYVQRWINAVQAAHVAHANMSLTYELRARSIGAEVPPEFQLWLLQHRAFSEEFFSVLNPVDLVPRVLAILHQLYTADPKRFEHYENLALAIAVVYDVPPPPDWPHGQVPASALPRRWPDPAAAFAWWCAQDEAHRTYQSLAELGTDELKFVVDAAAPFDDLEWSQQVCNYPLSQLEKAYRMVPYRQDRASNDGAIWPGAHYDLPEILGTGGLCVDQAYFATQVGKARGVPTLLFAGAGHDSRHAWFGYLGPKGNWKLDAGRYAEQRFVTGFARDPQTWGLISDHELKFLAERFRRQAAYRESMVHATFAADYLMAGDAAAARAAARRAVQVERRNRWAWETLLATGATQGQSPAQQDASLRDAMAAFAAYPDLEAYYAKRLTDGLRLRGATAEADREQQRLVRKYHGTRDDLSLQQAREAMLRSMVSQRVPEQMRTYETVLSTFGRGAGMAFFDQIVRVFVAHLAEIGERAEAVRAVERARLALEADPDSQLGQELARLLQQVKHG